MAVSFVADGGYNFSFNATVSLTVPSGVSVGDALLAVVSAQANTTVPNIPSPPSGWSIVGSTPTFGTGIDIVVFLLLRIATSADTSSPSYSFTQNGTGVPITDGNIIAYTGTDATSPVNGFSSASIPNTSASVVVPAVTETFASGEVAVAIATHYHSGATWSSLSPDTLSNLRNPLASSGQDVSYYILGDFTRASSAPPAETFTFAQFDQLSAMVATLIPPAGAPGPSGPPIVGAPQMIGWHVS